MKLKLTKKQKTLCDTVMAIKGDTAFDKNMIADKLNEIHREISGKIVGNVVHYPVQAAQGGNYMAYMIVTSMRPAKDTLKPSFAFKGKTVYLKKTEGKHAAFMEFDPSAGCCNTMVYTCNEIKSLNVITKYELLDLIEAEAKKFDKVVDSIYREMYGTGSPSRNRDSGKWITNGSCDAPEPLDDAQSWGIFG